MSFPSQTPRVDWKFGWVAAALAGSLAGLAAYAVVGLSLEQDHLESPLYKPLGALGVVVPSVVASIWVIALAWPKWKSLPIAQRVALGVPVVVSFASALFTWLAWF